MQELRQNGVFFYFFFYSHLQSINGYAFSLIAFNPSCFSGAVIIGKFFDFSGCLDKLLFGFSGIETATYTAPDRAREGKLVSFWSWLALSAEKYLHSVVFFKSNHLIVLAFILNSGVFNNSRIKNVCENLVNAASRQRIAANSFEFPRPKAPFVIGNIQNLRRRIASREHQIPHFANETETLWVFDDDFIFLVIEIAQ
ncbi:MAG: hypothetical protein A3J76_01020 [Candidatus Moranbacteria bacterium RBG_13_45_13]|nr:MAG: hypothetical protein A3J76_01020 [Candidatus Moranbacteria bacterium RBG_13_45_13]